MATEIYSYSLRITDTNQEQLYEHLKQYVQTQFIISVTEVGDETEKEHYHAVIQTPLKENTFRLRLRRSGLVKNKLYTLKQSTNTIQQAISYTIKNGTLYTNYTPQYLETIPIWIFPQRQPKLKSKSSKPPLIDTLITKYKQQWVIKRNYLSELKSSSPVSIYENHTLSKFRKSIKQTIIQHLYEFVIQNTIQTLYSRPHVIRYVITLAYNFYHVSGMFDSVDQSILAELESIFLS